MHHLSLLTISIEEGIIPQRIVTIVVPAPNSFAIISAATTFKALDAPIYNLDSHLDS